LRPISTSLTFFVNYYTYLAGFKSVVDRLNSFDAAIEEAQALSNAGPNRVANAAGARAIELDELDLLLPDGKRIVEAKHLKLAGGQSVSLAGPSGSGNRRHSAQFRVFGPLAVAASVRPRESRPWSCRQNRIFRLEPCAPPLPIRRCRGPTGMTKFAVRSSMLISATSSTSLITRTHGRSAFSSGEQQRLALARALLMRPNWLFLDESTSAVEEKLEAELYAVLAQRLPDTTVVSIGHRSTLAGLHQRHLEMTRKDDHFALRDAPEAAAAA
jgi:putative ATP-binding cassette transporter